MRTKKLRRMFELDTTAAVRPKRGGTRLQFEGLERRDLLAAFELQINDGAELTNFKDVEVSFEQIALGAERVQFAINGHNYGDWQDYEPEMEVRISNWNHTNWVNARVEFADGSVHTNYDSIDLYWPSFQLGDGLEMTNTRQVSIDFSQVDPTAEAMQFKFNGKSYSAPVDFAESTSVKLPSWVGTNYVDARITYANGSTRTMWGSIEYAHPSMEISLEGDRSFSRDIPLQFSNLAGNAESVQFAFNGWNFGAPMDANPATEVRIPNYDGVNYINAKIKYDNGAERWLWKSIDYVPLVTAEHCDDCVAFELRITDAPGTGFRDSELGDARVNAFSAAMEIWSSHLAEAYAGETVVIEASMEELNDWSQPGPYTLASEGPGIYELSKGNNSRWYPAALGNHEIKRDPDPYKAEISMKFEIAWNWYYGANADGIQESQDDFVSVALHEIGHGLGFTQTIGVDGQWSGNLESESRLPAVPGIYEVFLEDGNGQRLTEMTQTERETALVSGNLYWGGAYATAANGGVRPEIHAPTTFEGGSSVSHLDEFTHEHELLSPVYSGLDRTLSPIELGMLQDMGWHLQSGTSGIGLGEATNSDNAATGASAVSTAVIDAHFAAGGSEEFARSTTDFPSPRQVEKLNSMPIEKWVTDSSSRVETCDEFDVSQRNISKRTEKARTIPFVPEAPRDSAPQGSSPWHTALRFGTVWEEAFFEEFESLNDSSDLGQVL